MKKGSNLRLTLSNRREQRVLFRIREINVTYVDYTVAVKDNKYHSRCNGRQKSPNDPQKRLAYFAFMSIAQPWTDALANGVKMSRA